MACTSARVVCGASCVGAVDAPHIRAKVTLFLLPMSVAAIGGAIAGGRLPLARLLLNSLAADESIHFLDKRLRARKTMTVAARIGDVELLGWMSDTFGCCLDKAIITEAVKAGHREAVVWAMGCLQRSGFTRASTITEIANSAVVTATRAGHVEIARWLLPRASIVLDDSRLEDEAHTGIDGARQTLHGCLNCRRRNLPIDCSLWRMDENAAHGRLENVKWFHSNRSKHGCSVAAMDMAATNGHLDVVRWLHDNRTEGCSTAAMDGAACNGHLETLRFLHDHRSEGCTATALVKAAARGHLDVVQYLVENRLGEMSPLALNGAIANGRLDVVRWLIENNSGDSMNCAEGAVVPTEAAMDRAAANGHLSVLEFLHATSPVACTVAAIVGAATGGHEEVVRWLLEHLAAECLSFDTTESAVNCAAKNGHTAIIRLFYEHWTGSTTLTGDADKLTTALRTTFVVAAANGHLDTVKWLHRTIPVDSNLPESLAKVFDAAVRGSHLPVVRWIQRVAGPHLQLPTRKSTLDGGMVAAARLADFTMLEWIKTHRPEDHFRLANAPWVMHACISAATQDLLEVLQWFSLMYTGGSGGDTGWGRQACIRALARSDKQLSREWLAWSELSVGPI